MDMKRELVPYYGGETLAKAWVMNSYMQYFYGEPYSQHRFPFDSSDFVHFLHRSFLQSLEDRVFLSETEKTQEV